MIPRPNEKVVSLDHPPPMRAMWIIVGLAMLAGAGYGASVLMFPFGGPSTLVEMLNGFWLPFYLFFSHFPHGDAGGVGGVFVIFLAPLVAVRLRYLGTSVLSETGVKARGLRHRFIPWSRIRRSEVATVKTGSVTEGTRRAVNVLRIWEEGKTVPIAPELGGKTNAHLLRETVKRAEEGSPEASAEIVRRHGKPGFTQLTYGPALVFTFLVFAVSAYFIIR